MEPKSCLKSLLVSAKTTVKELLTKAAHIQMFPFVYSNPGR